MITVIQRNDNSISTSKQRQFVYVKSTSKFKVETRLIFGWPYDHGWHFCPDVLLKFCSMDSRRYSNAHFGHLNSLNTHLFDHIFKQVNNFIYILRAWRKSK